MVKLFSKNSNLCDDNSPTLQTDRQTDRRTDRQTTCDRNTALCTKVHRAVKIHNVVFHRGAAPDSARGKLRMTSDHHSPGPSSSLLEHLAADGVLVVRGFMHISVFFRPIIPDLVDFKVRRIRPYLTLVQPVSKTHWAEGLICCKFLIKNASILNFCLRH